MDLNLGNRQFSKEGNPCLRDCLRNCTWIRENKSIKKKLALSSRNLQKVSNVQPKNAYGKTKDFLAIFFGNNYYQIKKAETLLNYLTTTTARIFVSSL